MNLRPPRPERGWHPFKKSACLRRIPIFSTGSYRGGGCISREQKRNLQPLVIRALCAVRGFLTMAKPKTELQERRPSPPYTRWDQRSKPVLLTYLKLNNGKRVCLSLKTDERARQRGRMMPMGDTWELHRQGGKGFFWNGKVLTTRLYIDRKCWQWPLKGVDEEKAEELMGRVRVARQSLRHGAAEVLNCEIGTHAAMAAVAARAGARAQLASAIMMAGGPNELAEFVLNGPRETFPTAVSPQTVIPQVERRAIRKTARENCVARYIELIQAYS